jgi:hypothetical protein
MNAIVNLKQIHDQTMSESVLPEWPEILERQQALETPVWVAEWLAAAHVSTRLETEDTVVETWLEIAARQQPLDTPTWQTEWLDGQPGFGQACVRGHASPHCLYLLQRQEPGEGQEQHHTAHKTVCGYGCLTMFLALKRWRRSLT